ncbi:MAG: 3-isopropylmalate dehydratase large subunit [Candidatus Diapherotrites archaeon]|uniref:3-isopropylmalate dehydratase large subunit n=1 Tax=Candidatus Iainarchaeum sp. TaxID=3101447 RepID=A0A938YZ27_9ARCH|nr:3-isopropylmalate dehydratase large subunit [Candidatus Diapherotrites archaeon]
MSQTISEKILAAHSGNKEVSPGQLIEAKIDLCFGNDITAPIAIENFRKAGLSKVFDRERVLLIPDHFTPNKDIKTATQTKMMREFAQEQGLSNYFEVGRCGIEHVFIHEQGLALPGMLIVGADSHTCTYGALGSFSTGVGSTDLAAAMALGRLWFKVPESMLFTYNGKLQAFVSGKDLILCTIGEIGVDGALYKAMEFQGSTIKGLSMDSRFSMCNMAIEAGGKAGIIAPDAKTLAYVKSVSKNPCKVYKSDKGAQYSEKIDFDASRIEPQVAFPSLPENSKPVSEASGIEINQAVIGSCTNGRMEDMRIAAKIMKGKKLNPSVRCVILPGTQKIYLDCIKEGIAEIFVRAGCSFSTPTCGPCLGGHMGILAEGEKAISTTNRNFVGRMGHPKSEVYLSNPAVAAASAIAGKIVHPKELK